MVLGSSPVAGFVVSSYHTYQTLLLLSLMAKAELINVSMYSIGDLTAVHVRDDVMISLRVF